MNAKKLYRIELQSGCGLANEMAILAALSNGGKYISLKDIEAVAKTEVIRYPSLNASISINLIGEHDLTIDRGTENVLHLKEVEVLELVDEYAPTLNRQGILDETNPELLN